MKSILKLTLIICIGVLFAQCGLGPDYNLAINPPSSEATPAEIFPAEIDGSSPLFQNLKFGGMEAMYGKNKSITVARLSSQEEAIAYFKKNLLPVFNEQSNHFSGTVNGQFYAKASGGTWIMFGWVNQNYAIAIKSDSKERLDAIVNAFKYIEK